jgi:hypothetical protein
MSEERQLKPLIDARIEQIKNEIPELKHVTVDELKAVILETANNSDKPTTRNE